MRAYWKPPITMMALAVWMHTGCIAVKMPGRSFSGALPPLSDQEQEIAANLRKHVDVLGGSIGERNVWKYPALQAADKYIDEQLRQSGYTVEAQEYTANSRQVRNLIVSLRGAEHPEQIIVIGAHYDSVLDCPGANDNGSGVAAVLEMARQFSGSASGRTIRFVAFVNEEPPFFHGDLMGSLVYAHACKQRGESIVGMLSLETIGYYSDEKGSQHYPKPFGWLYPSRGNFIGFVSDWHSRHFLRDVVGSFRRHTKFPSEGVAAPRRITGIGWSDHWSFWQAGYPALMVTDTAPFRYKHYHRPSDTPEKIDYERTARVVAGLTRVVEELASQ